jgi:hypothetical protein
MHNARRGAEAEMPIDYRVHRSPLLRRPGRYAAPRIDGALLCGGCISSIRDPDTPVMSRVPRWKVT